MSDLETDLRTAERDLARDEAARLQRLFEEVRRTLTGPGSADDKVALLREKLG